MYRIRRFGVVRTATVVAVAYAIGFGILFIPLAIIGLLVGASPRGLPGGAGLVGASLLFLGFILLVIYPLLIWVATALACLVYNLAARWVGGIEVQVERPAAASSPGGWPPGGGPPPAYGQSWSPSPPGYPPPAQQGSWPPPSSQERR